MPTIRLRTGHAAWTDKGGEAAAAGKRAGAKRSGGAEARRRKAGARRPAAGTKTQDKQASGTWTLEAAAAPLSTRGTKVPLPLLEAMRALEDGLEDHAPKTTAAAQNPPPQRPNASAAAAAAAVATRTAAASLASTPKQRAAPAPEHPTPSATTVRPKNQPPPLTHPATRDHQQSGIESLFAFVEAHRAYYTGDIPSLEYLSDAGRADLVKVVRRLGGAEAAAVALTQHENERARACANPAAAVDARLVRRRAAAGHVVPVHMRGTPSAAAAEAEQRLRVRRPYVRMTPVGNDSAYAAPAASPTALAPPATFAADVENALARGLCLMIEHHATGRETDGFWTLWRTPLKAPSATADDVVRAAEACAKTYPTHHVRAAAFDNAKQSQSLSLVYHTPDATSA